MDRIRQDVVDGSWRRRWALVLAIGVLLQIWFWLRAVWIYRDQVELYTLGMALARDGELLPFGKLATGDFPIPGAVLELLVGLPLMAWFDYRASSLVLVIFHLTAALLLSRVLAKDLGWRVAAIFLALFWLSPWRLYHSGFLWEASYLLLPAAVHLTCCRRLRNEPTPVASAVLVATLLLTAQIHGSVLILLLCTLALLARRRLHLHAGGAILGSVIGVLPLVPTIAALVAGGAFPLPSTSTAGLLVRLNSLEKGVLYWLRLGSLDLGRRFRQSLYCRQPGGGDTVPEPWLCGLVHLTEILALASVVVALIASWWFFRRRLSESTEPTLSSSWGWYRHYGGSMLVATLIAAPLSPVLLQGWHVLIALPAACLPAAAWIAQSWPKAGSWLRALMLLFVVWRLPASLLLLGHPMYARPVSPELPRHIVPQELQPLIEGLPTPDP